MIFILGVGSIFILSQNAYSITEDDLDVISSMDAAPNDNTSPTLGLNNQYQRMVTNGFRYNELPVNVEYYYTEYPLTIVHIGDKNIAELKIFDDYGPEQIAHVELAFGLSKDKYFNQNGIVINYDIDSQGIGTVSQVDPDNIIDDDTLKIEHKHVSCIASSHDDDCLLVKIFHTFKKSKNYDIIRTNIWDKNRNTWQNFFNHGINIEGLSNNQDNGILVNNNTLKLYPILDNFNQTKFMIDENNVVYVLTSNGVYETLRNNSSLFDKITEPINEDFPSHGLTRSDLRFQEYKAEQSRTAKILLNTMTNNINTENLSFGGDYNYPIVENFDYVMSVPDTSDITSHGLTRSDLKFQEYKVEQARIANIILNNVTNNITSENLLFEGDYANPDMVNFDVVYHESIQNFTSVRLTPEFLKTMKNEELKATLFFEKHYHINNWDD